MNITSVARQAQTASISGLQAQRPSATQDAQSVTDDSSLSEPASLFKKLEALAKSDPAKFKEAATEISAKLKEAADAANDPREKAMLTSISDKFSSAAESGDVSGLKPPQGPPPGGGRPPPPPGGGGGGGGSKTTEPADTNKDGTVTLLEQAAYDAKSKQSSESTALSAYKQVLHASAEEKANSLFSSLNSIVDAVSAQALAEAHGLLSTPDL